MPDQPKLVYILSPSYSGSTLLTLMLAQVNGIATIGELKASAIQDIDSYLCSCGNLIHKCEFWRDLAKKLSDQGIDFSVEDFDTHFDGQNALQRRVLLAQCRGEAFEFLRYWTTKLLPGLNNEITRVLDRNVALAEAIIELQDGKLLLDGSKDPQRLIYFLNSGKFDISVIRMVRDGRAQCNSRREKEQDVNPVDYAGARREFRSTIDQMDYVARRIPPERLLSLTYESLCEDPAKELSRIVDWLGLPQPDIDWADVDLRSRPHHVLGNSMRIRERISIRLDEGWKERVSPSEAAEFDRIAGHVNKRLGYA